jgi:hypothetical protein
VTTVISLAKFNLCSCWKYVTCITVELVCLLNTAFVSYKNSYIEWEKNGFIQSLLTLRCSDVFCSSIIATEQHFVPLLLLLLSSIHWGKKLGREKTEETSIIFFLKMCHTSCSKSQVWLTVTVNKCCFCSSSWVYMPCSGILWISSTNVCALTSLYEFSVLLL